MLHSLHISGFRCFRELRVRPLARVNLFVGTNNSGKTSILEAAEILASGAPQALWRSPSRRDEYILDAASLSMTESEIELDPSHLFHGHLMLPGRTFSLHDEVSSQRVHCEVIERTEGPVGDGAETLRPSQPPSLEPLGPPLGLAFTSWWGTRSILPLSSLNGLPPVRRLRVTPLPNTEIPTISFLGTEQPEGGHLSQLWDSVALTSEENEVTDALRLIEPSIERIAFLGESRRPRSFFLRLSGLEQRIPLGSVGDGLKRLLALALHLQSAKGGLLLVDEIDTGLHYTVLAKMWKLVIAAARRLDLQVLATTHSRDCVEALATVHVNDPGLTTEVLVHRVEKDECETVFYAAEEIAIAAERRIEVR
jgi:hypothetical protein